MTCFQKLHLYGFALLLAAVSAGPAAAAESPAVDLLKGGRGRAELQRTIDALVFEGGKSFPWEDFAAWGKEIFLTGSVKSPPTGVSPSKPVSKLFRCSSCHNMVREDPDLTVQDPERRFLWSEETGGEVFLLQGATLWGAVNRSTFYPDHFEIYHHLCVPKGEEPSRLPCGPLFKFCRPGCRTMDPESLRDATQVCSAYCSVGRYLKAWELYALLAFFRDLELTLDDLGMPPVQAARIEAVLSSPAPDSAEVRELRAQLAGAFSGKAANTSRGIPAVKKDRGGVTVMEYEDGGIFAGDNGRGERLWPLSCGRCHSPKGKPLTAEKAHKLKDDLQEFHEMLAKGTRHRFKRYMPNFTLERLSRQQAADILAYLQKASGRSN